jgi:hypothetical protein
VIRGLGADLGKIKKKKVDNIPRECMLPFIGIASWFVDPLGAIPSCDRCGCGSTTWIRVIMPSPVVAREKDFRMPPFVATENDFRILFSVAGFKFCLDVEASLNALASSFFDEERRFCLDEERRFGLDEECRFCRERLS